MVGAKRFAKPWPVVFRRGGLRTGRICACETQKKTYHVKHTATTKFPDPECSSLRKANGYQCLSLTGTRSTCAKVDTIVYIM